MARFGWPMAARMVLAGVAWCCLAAGMASAADGPRLLKQGEEHYQFAEWSQARQALNQALKTGGLSPTQAARAHFHLGLVAAALGDAAEAKAYFSQARTADPGWSPDPAQFPPDAMALFHQATATAGRAPAGPPAPPPPLPPAPTPALQPPAGAIQERELPPAPAVEPAPEPRFDQQELIEKRRQARLTFVEGVDLFNAGRFAEAEQRFLAFLAVFPGDNEGERFLGLTQKTLATQRSGGLRVASKQPATVYLDGQRVGETPLALDNLPLGRHLVEVRAGEASQSQEIEIKGRTTTSIEFDLTRFEVPAEPASAGTGTYRHPALGFSLSPPSGWGVVEKPADADLKLTSPGGRGYIQVSSIPSQRQLDPATYAALWEMSFLAAQPGAQRLISQALAPASQASPAWRAEYAGNGARTVAVFVSRPQRMYVLAGSWPAEDHAGMLAAFEAATASFRAP